MRCEEVQDRLAEHLLGALAAEEAARVRRHVRGCAACRRELSALEEGLTTFARAAHDATPPPELRERVLRVLEEEWSEEAARPGRRVPLARAAAVVAVLVLAASVAWGVASDRRADRYEERALRYEAFLQALGGEAVRVGTLVPAGPRAVEGNLIVYESAEGRSWVLVSARVPGAQGEAVVTLLSDGRKIDLRPMAFDEAGEAWGWLVTATDLSSFSRASLWVRDTGEVLATADLPPA